MSKELLDKIPKPSTTDYRLESVESVNHRPHPYTVGAKHVAHASDHCSGRLGEETMRAVPCAHPRCTLAYEDHKSDRVLFIKALVDKEVKDLEGIQEYLKSIADQLTALGIDGVVFVSKN